MIYTVSHIPRDTPYNRRPGYFMMPTSITIHTTGNPSSTARDERDWLTNPNNGRTASFHIVVDEHEAIECIPLTENAWHAGDGNGFQSGNRTSVGIEICESGDFSKSVSNALEIVLNLLNERHWGVSRLRRHYDWSGKICPRLMYNGGTWQGWKDFVQRVDDKINPKIYDANFVINGKEIDPGVLISGRTYAPVRALLTELDVPFRWDGETRTVYIDQ